MSAVSIAEGATAIALAPMITFDRSILIRGYPVADAMNLAWEEAPNRRMAVTCLRFGKKFAYGGIGPLPDPLVYTPE